MKGGKRVTKGGRHVKIIKITVLSCQVLVGTYWSVSKAFFFVTGFVLLGLPCL